MLQMIFESENGRPAPRLPREKDGSPRVADGVKYLSLSQAAKAFGMSETSLGEFYLSCFGDLLPGKDTQELTAPAPDLTHPVLEETAGEKGESGTSPSATDSATPAINLVDQAKLDLLHVLKFPHISDEHFNFFVEACRQRQLNPWANQIYADVKHNDRRNTSEVVIIVGIEGLRLLASRTRVHAGTDAAVFDYDTDERKPIRARVVVYKLVDNHRCPYEGVAWWDEYYPLSDGVFPEQMPHLWLGKCAEASALRQAFPAELGGIYTPDEWSQQPRRGSSSRQATNEGTEDNPAGDETIDEDSIPSTYRSLELALIDLNISDARTRQDAMKRLREKFKRFTDERAFCAAAWKDVRRNPKAYGAAEEPQMA